MKAVKRDAREMKDSGIEWIGEMPQLWSTARLKDICSIQTGTTPDKKRQDEYYTNEGGIPWIKAENLGDSTPISITKEYLTDKGANAGRVFANNTVYVCCIASIGKVGYSEITCSCNQQINGLIFDSKYIDYKYGFYMSLAQEEEYMLRASGNVLKILNTQQQSYIPCVVPSLREQQAIADYLDDRCAKIDAIIAEAKASIEEYKELKQAVIYEAVTKGINKAVNLKNSHIQWMRKIADFMVVKKIKYITQISRGLFSYRPRNASFLYDGPYPFIQTGDVARANHYIIEYKQTLSEEGKKVSRLFPKGTLTMTIAANVGDVSILGFDAYFPDSVLGFVPYDDYSSEYLYYIFSAMKEEFVLNAISNTQLNLNIERVKELYIPVVENKYLQNCIIAYLDKRTSDLDGLIDEKQSLIEDLESYKKSLIYEVVTGKRKVVD